MRWVAGGRASTLPASSFALNRPLVRVRWQRESAGRRWLKGAGGGGICTAWAAPVSSFYISYRGFYSATRPPGAPRDPGSPSQALWVGEDRTWPPCPRSGRSAPRTLAHRAPWGARKRRRSGWANGTRLAPMACSTTEERPRTGTGPAQRQPYGPGGHVPRRDRILRRRSGRRLRNGIRAFRPPWYPTEPPHALRRVTQARWVASARTKSGSIRAFRWIPPPLGGHRVTSGPCTPTTRAPSAPSVIGWVLAARRASRCVRARTSGRWRETRARPPRAHQGDHGHHATLRDPSTATIECRPREACGGKTVERPVGQTWCDHAKFGQQAARLFCHHRPRVVGAICSSPHRTVAQPKLPASANPLLTATMLAFGRAQVSREPPLPLPGGYVVGEQVYYMGAGKALDSGNRLEHGKQGEVVGAVTSANQKGKGVDVLFPGNKRAISCLLTHVRRHRRRAATHSSLPPQLPILPADMIRVACGRTGEP
eukprot:scaffold21191_cov53-Phaeocystis_antarctica.AAC.2